jgi:sulfite reductase (NADPH) flavoprotein alpha-component
LDAVSLFKKLEAGEVKAVWIMGTNPVASMPNRQRVINGLGRADLVIVLDAYHPTETSHYADILLPGAVWAEAEGTMVNSERNITLMQPAVSPPGDAQPDWWIVAQMARQLGFDQAFPYQTAADVFDEIRQTHNPKTGYDLRGISYERLREKSRKWPCAPGMDDGKSIRYLTEANAIHFPTASGKGQFLARPCLPPGDLVDADFPFTLNTGRLAHQWHTLTKTGKVPVLNKLNPGPFVEIHPEDAAALGVFAGALVKVASRRGFAIYPAQVSTRVQPGNCFVPFHWNDQFGGNLAVNAATSEAVDAISLQPEFKICAVSLTRAPVELREEFTPPQKAFLRTFLAEFRAKDTRQPRVPVTAPFTPTQRTYLNELLAQTSAVGQNASTGALRG